jgi:hypothetical protein
MMDPAPALEGVVRSIEVHSRASFDRRQTTPAQVKSEIVIRR